MKISRSLIACIITLLITTGCDKDGNYPGGVVSPYIAIFDIRDQHKGSDVTLTTDKLYGSSSITGVVVSDHTGGNMPDACHVRHVTCAELWRLRLADVHLSSCSSGGKTLHFAPMLQGAAASGPENKAEQPV